MSDIQLQIEQSVRQALSAAFGEEVADTDPLVRPATNPQFGDFQLNVAMSLAKSLQRKPRNIAEAIASALPDDAPFEKVEIAGPGFINLTLSNEALARFADTIAHDAQLGIERADPPQHVVVDYSCPNVAKQMHVGHLRSTVIGDAIVRVLQTLGHNVTRQNHLGDWGTQFGMLIEELFHHHGEDQIARGLGIANDGNGVTLLGPVPFSDLAELYRDAKVHFDSDPVFAEAARRRVVALQRGNELTTRVWRWLIEQSERHFHAVYDRLGVLLTRDDVRAESFYNDQLANVIRELESAGQLKESAGAAVVYPEGFKDREGEPQPMIVRKSDGGYLYATTDLAAARYRIRELEADRIIYVTDARQRDHFGMVFQTLRQSGWAPASVRLDHVAFGTVLGPDRRPFKTREGGTVRLIDLLDEAETRALAVIESKATELDAAEKQQVARVVGIGALKYADLSSDRIKDYVFDWDRMLALDGNTAPYLIYSYVRIRSIFRRAEAEGIALPSDDAAIFVNEAAERALVLKLLQLPHVVAGVADALEPHRLCNYLFELAALFHQFFEQCPVLKADGDDIRSSRLRLCDVTARALRASLNMLGIETVERM